MREILGAFLEYIETPGYLHGLFVEFTGVALEVLLILILVPIFVRIYNRVRTRHVRFMVSFYLLQIFHKIARTILRLADKPDVVRELVSRMPDNPDLVLSAHELYGNLENVLELTDAVLVDGTFDQALKGKQLSDVERSRKDIEGCLEEVDRLATMMILVPRAYHRLFTVRALIYALRDKLVDLEEVMASENKGTATLEGHHKSELGMIGREITLMMSDVFNQERRLIDSVLRNRRWRFFVALPVIMPKQTWRLLSKRFGRMKSKNKW